jgi:DNA-binding phage protein
MRKSYKSYQSYLIESLKDPQAAAAYLDAVMEDGTSEEVQLALKNVAEAQILMADKAHTAHRKAIYETLSQQQLDFPTLLTILGELGFRMSVAPREDAA